MVVCGTSCSSYSVRSFEEIGNVMSYQEIAKTIVRDYVEKRLDKSDPHVDFDVYVVWFAKTLQNWKCLISTTLPDGMYYEVTHNGDMNDTYLDAYKKVDNKTITERDLRELADQHKDDVDWSVTPMLVKPLGLVG